MFEKKPRAQGLHDTCPGALNSPVLHRVGLWRGGHLDPAGQTSQTPSPARLVEPEGHSAGGH